MGWYWAFVWGALAFGGIFAGVGLSLERVQTNLKSTGVPVNVEVIELHQSRDSDGDTTYTPEFKIISGIYKGETWKGTFSSNPPAHDLGDRESGLYDPESGRIQSHSVNRGGILFSLIFSSLGLGIMMSGLIFWLRARGI